MLTLIENGYVARSVTPRGEDILKTAVFEDAGDRDKTANEKQAAARALMGEAHDYTTAPARLLARFDDMDFWRAQSDKCISCGACTYMCPTCYCFNITDNNLEAVVISVLLLGLGRFHAHKDSPAATVRPALTGMSATVASAGAWT